MQTVLYWLCGAGYAETMAVSLYHLRKHWQGDILLAYASNCKDSVANTEATWKLANAFDTSVAPITLPNYRRHQHYIAKASLWRQTVGQTLFLDADTVPLVPIDPLFTDALMTVHFSDWYTHGRIIGGRMRSFVEHSGLGFDFSDSWPAINTGVVAWGPAAIEHGILEQWEVATQQGHAAPFTDELAMQWLLPTAFRGPMKGASIERDCWNYSPTHGRTQPPKIYHFHGRRHVRKPEGRKIWQPLAVEAITNTPGLADWWGSFDEHVAFVRELAA